MTSEQLLEATSRGRGKESETPRLISTHDQHHRRCEFVQSLLYMIVNCSVRVKEVVRIVTFRHERLFADYLQGLQNLRAQSTSNLESRLIKNLANSIPGVRLMFVYFVLCCIITSHTYQQATLFSLQKFHQNAKSFLRAKCSTTKEQLLENVKSPNFVDIFPISDTTAICSHDGIQIRCNNLPHIRW